MKQVLYHIYKRKAAGEGGLSRKPAVKVLDTIALANGIFGSLTPVTQIYASVSAKDTSGVSLLTWSLFIVSSLVWLVYGAYHRDRPIFYSSLLGIIVNFGVIISVLWFSAA